jgi:Tfp pilus assembly protein PilF
VYHMSRSPSRTERAQACLETGAELLGRGAFELARAEFEQAIQLNPQLAVAHLGLAKVHRAAGDWAKAEQAARASLVADPTYAMGAHFIGGLLVEQDRLAEGLPFLKAAAEWAPGVAQFHRDLGVTQLYLGDLAGARERLMQTMELDVHAHEVLYTLIRMWTMSDGSAEAERLLETVRALEAESGALPGAERDQVLFSLGKAQADRQEYAAAAETFARANALKRATLDYNVGVTEARFREVADVFSAERIAKLKGGGATSNRPIFIVGMPRSGSTLVEHILGAHPDVHAPGEVPILHGLLQQSKGIGGASYPAWGRTMNPVDCASIGKAYLDRLPAGLPSRSRTTDKWLDNFEHLGLIAVCLPNAKVIHCQRDPRDQLLSIWSLLFSNSQEFAYDIDDLVRYWRAYQRLMAHWRAVLPPGQMLEVRYETLVEDPEGSTRAILDHCGLEWDDSVLRFWESRRPVRTASMFQVREPVYDRSIGRWKPFQPYLSKLFDALGLDPNAQSALTGG